MVKKGVCLILILAFTPALCGCWNYRGLNEILVVAGIAVDKVAENGNYLLSFEVVDLALPVKENGLRAKIVESEGKTLFDAIRNAKKKLADKLYFGHAQIVVISENIARSEDIGGIIDWFMRDGELRETICFAISQEKTARDILNIKGIDNAIISIELQEVLKSDRTVTSSTIYIELYEIFDTIKAEGKALALPAIHHVLNDGELTSEVNGVAVFRDNKLVGYLTPEESKYFLFAVNEVKGGILAVSSTGETYDVSLEISKNATKRSFVYRDGTLKIRIKTETTVYLDEYRRSGDALDEQQMLALKSAAEAELERNIMDVIQKVTSEFDSDIFGFGNMIYKKDYKLWERLRENWDEQFRFLDVEVDSIVNIVNTASMKKT